MAKQDFMALQDALQLKPGDQVKVLVGGCGDVNDETLDFEAGEIVMVDDLDTLPAPQGLAVTICASNGVVNVFDASDFNGVYPFERVPS